MNIKTKSKNPAKSTDLYQKVTDIIIGHLEKGVIPWRLPHVAQAGFPANFKSGNRYRGVNVLMLGTMMYVSPWFLTYIQAKALGGQVRKGEKGHTVIKWGQVEKKVDKTEPKENETTSSWFLRGYTVFNASQIDGIDFPEIKKPDFKPSEKVAKAKELVVKMPNAPKITEGHGARSCYKIWEDEVTLPDRAYFESEERYFQTLFHELVHATGAKMRLDRKSLTDFSEDGLTAKETYAKEELVAEIGASFLMAHAGIALESHEQNAAYVGGWLRVLREKENCKWLIQAAGDAQKAVNYILGIS